MSWCSLYSMLSPAGRRARLATFIFHRVRPEPDPLLPDAVHARQFDQMLGWIGCWFQVLPLDEAVRRLAAGTLPARAAAISFDDGYADNQEVALPILRRHGMPATFFIATGFLNGGRMWNDSLIETVRHTRLDRLELPAQDGAAAELLDLSSLQARYAAVHRVIMRAKYLEAAQRQVFVDDFARMASVTLAPDSMMSDAQLLDLHRAGMQIGAHTVSHPILSGLDSTQLRRELSDSRATLEALIGDRVGLLAYPNGKPGQDYDQASVAMARELGFDAAFTTVASMACGASDPFQIPRFTPWQPGRQRFALALAGALWRSRAEAAALEPGMSGAAR